MRGVKPPNLASYIQVAAVEYPQNLGLIIKVSSIFIYISYCNYKIILFIIMKIELL